MTPRVVDRWESRGWAEARPSMTVAVATHNRAAFLPELVASVAAQDVGAGSLELVLVDDGSTDETAAVLPREVTRATSAVLGVRIAATGGPSVPRNVAASHARTPYLLFTDDDCLPTPTWASTLHRHLAAGADVVQGRTAPRPEPRPGPWARSIWVEQPGPLYETCNIGYRKAAFDAAGGFPVLDLLHARGAPRGFGEDAALGCAVARTGRSEWAPDALVHHRWLPATFADHLAGRRRVVAFPALAAAVPEVGDALTGEVFLSRRTLRFDAAVVGIAAAAVLRRPAAIALAVPWMRATVAQARELRLHPATGTARLALADAVGLASLVEGSVRAGRIVV